MRKLPPKFNWGSNAPTLFILMDVQKAVDMGATAAVNSRSSTDAIEEVMEETGRRGVDVALEAVGLPSTFELCQARRAQLPITGCHW